jgi:DNA modification methylase
LGDVTCRVLQGDCREVLKRIPDSSVHCAVTSPPYFGLRDYGKDGQIGLESTPDEYVENMVEVFREVRRVLRDDGTLWLNLGDSYNAAGRSGHGTRQGYKQGTNRASATATDTCRPSVDYLKPKDLIGIPWRVAFALQADGWYLRQDIIWHKPNPMPESVTDRCTKAHEYLFLLSKSERYHFDAAAIKERSVTNDPRRPYTSEGAKQLDSRREWKSGQKREGEDFSTRNRRSVWTVTTKPFKGAHFATFPPDLIEPCILAGCPRGGTVLDPFGGAGTTGLVAERLGRVSILIELNEGYCQMARDRIRAGGGKVECSLPEAGRDSGPLFQDAAE